MAPIFSEEVLIGQAAVFSESPSPPRGGSTSCCAFASFTFVVFQTCHAFETAPVVKPQCNNNKSVSDQPLRRCFSPFGYESQRAKAMVSPCLCTISRKGRSLMNCFLASTFVSDSVRQPRSKQMSGHKATRLASFSSNSSFASRNRHRAPGTGWGALWSPKTYNVHIGMPCKPPWLDVASFSLKALVCRVWLSCGSSLSAWLWLATPISFQSANCLRPPLNTP
ncbi:unnamed protein product [Prorocentrum cordatum]|uniref:Uncharacterized protein n=1 Tax=Prorocentrum cordatum TaxID=2364126 RepID=A0ABN9RXD0_9DINO|nr:unnamed protein product [Polarella glacialis]